MTIHNFPEANYGTELVGPFTEKWKVISRGYEVPHLSAIQREDGEFILFLDDRFMIEAPPQEMKKWVSFIANAMAVAAGYSCHGENCQPINPYKVRVTSLEGIPND